MKTTETVVDTILLVLDRTKVVEGRCGKCNESFSRITGAIFGDGLPVGFYIAVLHGHRPEGRLAHLAIVLCPAEGVDGCAALAVTSNTANFHFRFLDWSETPLDAEELDPKLNRASVLRSPLRPLFLHAAEQVVRVPQISEYFCD